MSEIKIIDSTTRDGVQSLWALRLTAPELLAIAPVMDRAGFKVIDFSGPGIWQYCARFLNEDAWERVRLTGETISKTVTPTAPEGLDRGAVGDLRSWSARAILPIDEAGPAGVEKADGDGLDL